MEKFAAGKIRARKYRNRRIGEFFKEIDLSEKQSTGITKILRELQQNGSPPPEFETDSDRTYLITTIRMREGFKAIAKNFAQINKQSLSEVLSEALSSKEFVKLLPIIEYLEVNDRITPKEAEILVNKSSATVRRYLGLLVSANVLISKGSTTNIIYHRI